MSSFGFGPTEQSGSLHTANILVKQRRVVLAHRTENIQHDGRTVDGKSELCPVGEGNIDHRRALELLMNDGWDGYMSGEWIGWEPRDVHLPRELEIMKGYEKELSG